MTGLPADVHDPATGYRPADTRSLGIRAVVPKRALRLSLRTLIWCLAAAARLGRRVMKPRKSTRGIRNRTLVITGTFYTTNWILNHLRPLASSRACKHIWLVAYIDLPSDMFCNVTVVRPPGWLRCVLGPTPARLLTFAWTSLQRRPDFLVGYNFRINGLVAAALAPWLGARSVVSCGGGFGEITSARWDSNYGLFGLLSSDVRTQKYFCEAANATDIIATRGQRAVADFRAAGVTSRLVVIPGGIDPARYVRSDEPKQYDLILVAQLIPVKRISLFLNAVRLLANKLPSVRAVIVGRGMLDSHLKTLAKDLGLDRHILFAGYQEDVNSWLAKSKVFVLTSESEGLSLAMMEAMMAGLPVVVPDVGDLCELVEDGRNGFLVKDATPDAFAQCILPLLQDERKRRELGECARQTAMSFSLAEVTRRWDEVLDGE